MKSTAFFGVLLNFFLVQSALAVDLQFKKGAAREERFVPNKFIIEVEHLADIPDIQRRDFTRSLDVVYSSLRRRNVEFEVKKEFDSEGLFVGASLTLNTPEDAAALEEAPGVKAIHPVRIYKKPQTLNDRVVSSRDDPAVPNAVASIASATGLDKVHARGATGKGISVAVIDTGIDYNHPALGGGFGPGFKVTGGYDFVGDTWSGTSTDEPIPDDDPMDCHGHGTHVAGTIAANPGNDLGVVGVAYDATLTAYRVFSCDSATTDEIIIEALLRAVADNQDVLNLSLGGSDGWTTSPSSVVASRIASRGKIVVIAAGNDGDIGPWYSSSPSTGIDVISVASVNNPQLPLQNATLHGVDAPPVTYWTALRFPIDGEVPIYANTFDTTVVDDGCQPLSDDLPDLSNAIVLLRRGTCTFVAKVRNAAVRGAKGVLFYDNGNGPVPLGGTEIPAAVISAADGEFIVSQLANNVSVSISFPHDGAVQVPDPTGGFVSSFSTYGPTNDMFMKPAVAAHGGGILSTIPGGSYALKSGTSMATPFVAGASALLLQVRGNTANVARSAKNLFQTTASRLPSDVNDSGYLPTVAQAGAGLINVYNALYSKTDISKSELLLNDTANFVPLHTFSITNRDTKAKTFRLNHVAAGTALTTEENGIPTPQPVRLVDTAASVEIFPRSFTLRPGASQVVSAFFRSPQLNAATLPVYSGYIEAVSGSEVHRTTYLGAAASLKQKQVLDTTDYFRVWGERLPIALDAQGYPQTAPTNYTFNVDEGDYPSFIWRKTFGTPLMRVDLVDASLTIPGVVRPRETDSEFAPQIVSRSPNRLDTRSEDVTNTLAARGPLGRPRPGFLFGPWQRPRADGTVGGVKIVGTLYSAQYIPRNDNDATLSGSGVDILDWDEPTFANGTAVPNGLYRVLIRSLRVTGNPDRLADYGSWLSPIVGVTVQN